MNITPINKLYDVTDLNDESFFDLHTAFEVKHEELSTSYKPSGNHSQYWEYATLIKSTNPAAGDTVLVTEGYRNPRSTLPFYLKDLGCNVYVCYKHHSSISAYGMSTSAYEATGINLINRSDWINIPDFGINFDVIYCIKELEHTHPSGDKYLSTTSYDEVLSVAKSTIDSWLTVSTCVACTHNLFGSNCNFDSLSSLNEWTGSTSDYYHPFSSSRLTQFLAMYSISSDYETNWETYYQNNTPLVSRINQDMLNLNTLYTVASFIIQ